MAIQYVGGTSATAAGSTTVGATVSLTALTGGIGTVAAAGDLVIVGVCIAAITDKVMSLTTAGYRTIVDLYANDSFDANLGVFTKFMGTSADTSVVVPPTGAANDGMAIVVNVWRGVDPVSPFDETTPATVVATNGRFVNPAATTPTGRARTLIVVGGAATGGTAVAPIQGNILGNFVSTALTTGVNRPMIGIGSAGNLSSTGGVNDPSAWSGGSSANTESNASVAFYLRPNVPDYREIDFEGGTLASSGIASFGTGTSVVTGQGQVGTFCGASTIGLGSPGNGFQITTDLFSVIGGNNTWYHRYRFKIVITSNPTSATDVIIFDTKEITGTQLFEQRVQISTTGGIQFYNYENFTPTTLGPFITILPNTWYEAEVELTDTGLNNPTLDDLYQVKTTLNNVVTYNDVAVFTSFRAPRVNSLQSLALSSAGLAGTVYFDNIESAIDISLLSASTTNFPVVQGRQTGRDAADALSRAITFPAGIQSGEMLLAVCLSDGNPNISITSGSGWNCARVESANGVTSKTYWKIADGTANDNLTLATSASEQMSWITYRILGGKYCNRPEFAYPVASTNFDPPSSGGGLALHKTQPYLFIATALADVQVVATVAPTNYTNLTTIAGATTTGVSISAAERLLYADVEDPAAFTNASATGLTSTIMISPYDPLTDDFPTVMSHEAIVTASGTSHTCPAPAGTVAGDLLLVSVAAIGSTTISGGVIATGWREVSELVQVGTNTTVTAGLYWKLADGTSADNITITTGTATTTQIGCERIINGNSIAWQAVGFNASGTFDTLPSIDLTTPDTLTGLNYTGPRPYLALNRACFNIAGSPLISFSSYTLNANGTQAGGWSTTAGNGYVVHNVVVEPAPAKNIEFVASTAISIPGTIATTSIPLTGMTAGQDGDTAPRAGDIVVVQYAVASTQAIPVPTGGLSISTAGYTTIDYIHQHGQSTYKTSGLVAYKFMGAVPDTTVVLNQTGNAANAGAASVYVLRGVDPTNPVFLTRNSGTTGATPPNVPQLGYIPGSYYAVSYGAQSSATTATALVTNTNDAAIAFAYSRIVTTSDTNAVSFLSHAGRFADRIGDRNVYTGGPASAVGSSIAQGCLFKPAAVPTSYKWDFESGDFDYIFDYSPSLASVITTGGTGQVGSFSGRYELGSLDGFRFTRNLYEDEIYTQWRFKLVVTALPAVQEIISLFLLQTNDADNIVDVRAVINPDGTIFLRVNNPAGSDLTPDYAITSDTWYVAALGTLLKFNGTGTLDFKINDTTVISGTSLINAGYFRNAIQRIQFRGSLVPSGTVTSVGYVVVDEVEYNTVTWPTYVPLPTGGGTMAVWTGAAWVQKPVKYWSGSAWTQKSTKYWNGTSWVLT